MVKYKLIKEYPGSPELGTEIFNDGVFKGHYYAHVNGIKTHLGTIEPYKYPEFWEEVVEKDYEILSVIIPNYNQICKKEGNYFVAKRGGINPFILGTHIDYKIHSVKRLSDGEI